MFAQVWMDAWLPDRLDKNLCSSLFLHPVKLPLVPIIYTLKGKTIIKNGGGIEGL